MHACYVFPAKHEESNRKMKVRKFSETMDYGRTTARAAYAVDPSHLPEPKGGCEWREDPAFSETEAVRAEPELAKVLERARRTGCVTVE